jgi:hypothetical protein
MVGLEDAKNQTVCIHVVNGRIQVDSFHPFWGLEETKQFLSIHPSKGRPSLACHTQQRGPPHRSKRGARF